MPTWNPELPPNAERVTQPSDPVFYVDAHDHVATGWYFYSETWSDFHGPYESRAAASKACGEYAQTL